MVAPAVGVRADADPARSAWVSRSSLPRCSRLKPRRAGDLSGILPADTEMALEDDTAILARQIAELTRGAVETARQLEALRARADSQQERADTQQERIDLAARELTEVSARLQAAAAALRESV